MVSINYATREVTCKIVYYGPGLSGKTTNLQLIHDKVPTNTRGKMISLATEADRTLYFDFLPINIGTISGFAAKFQLYTVPGQVYYNATRKLVLRGTDGLVFVADSQVDKMDENIESLNNMKENLAEYGYDISDVPIVIQYNKRDLPNILPVEELEAKLNEMGWKHFEASAVTGEGVFDTLKMIIKLVLDKARSSHSAASKPKSAAASEPQKAEAAVTASAGEAREEVSRTQAYGQANSGQTESSAGETKTDIASPTDNDTAPIRESAYLAESSATDVQQPDSSGGYEVPADQPPIAREEKDAAAGTSSSPESDKAPIEQDSWGQDRPFPGTTGKIPRRGKRITVSDFQPVGKDEDISTLKGGSSDTDSNEVYENEDNMPTPTMAKSNRVVRKKRGFFKRLFGMK